MLLTRYGNYKIMFKLIGHIKFNSQIYKLLLREEDVSTIRCKYYHGACYSSLCIFEWKINCNLMTLIAYH